MSFKVCNAGESISAKFDGALRSTYANAQDYIVDDIGDEFAMTTTASSLQVTVGTGVANICGRGMLAEENNSITLQANTISYLCLRIDLTQTTHNEGMLYANTSSTIASDNLNNTNGQHDLLLGIITTDTNGVVSVSDQRNIKNKSSTLDFNLIYPVGSIYMSINSTNPSTLFGGTWEQLKDKFLLSAGDTYAGGSTGGSASNSHTHTLSHTHSVTTSGSVQGHTLTIAEMPSHTHSYTHTVNKPWDNIIDGEGRYDPGVTGTTGATGGGQAHSHGFTGATVTSGGASTSTTSGSSDTNNMPPYLAVYVWKRTA